MEAVNGERLEMGCVVSEESGVITFFILHSNALIARAKCLLAVPPPRTLAPMPPHRFLCAPLNSSPPTTPAATAKPPTMATPTSPSFCTLSSINCAKL